MDPLPLPWFIFGSTDSLDTDVLVQVEEVGARVEAEALIKTLEAMTEGWSINLISVQDGHVTATLPPKGTADGLNNSLFLTYDNHLDRQQHPNPIRSLVPRHRALTFYRALRALLNFCTRTQHRALIRPHLRGIHPFALKLDMLAAVDFRQIEGFGNKYTSDVAIWKSMAFSLGQALSLEEGVEIYTKAALIEHHPTLAPFIRRQALSAADKAAFQESAQRFLDLLRRMPFENPESGLLILGAERVDMVMEVAMPLSPSQGQRSEL